MTDRSAPPAQEIDESLFREDPERGEGVFISLGAPGSPDIGSVTMEELEDFSAQ